MLIVVLIILLVIVGFVLYKSFKSYKVPNNNIICFTGTLGTGKTYLAVAKARADYRRKRIQHWIYKHFKLIAWFIPSAKHPASLYSNIPIRTNLSKKNPKYCRVLRKEHVLMTENLPENCTVLIDEIGQVCSQWEFDNPYVMENVQTLARFFRHFTNGKMFVTDQVSDNIVKPIRDRLGFIYQLNDFHRVFKLLPYYQVSVIPIMATEVGKTDLEQDTPEEYYFFGFLPYKWMKIKHYESRCFKPLYYQNAVKDIDAFDSLYTTYLIDISASHAKRKEYKQDKEKFKSYLYDRFPALNSPQTDETSETAPVAPADDSALMSFKI